MCIHVHMYLFTYILKTMSSYRFLIPRNHSGFLAYHVCSTIFQPLKVRKPLSLSCLLIWPILLYVISFPSLPTYLCEFHPYSTEPWKPAGLILSPATWTPSSPFLDSDPWCWTSPLCRFPFILFWALMPHATLSVGLMYSSLASCAVLLSVDSVTHG